MQMKAVAHHPPSVAQPVLSSNSSVNLPLSFIADRGTIWYRICLWALGMSCSGYGLSKILLHPQIPTGGVG